MMQQDKGTVWFELQATKIYRAKHKGCWVKWLKQIMTPYDQLSPAEQAYDQRKAREYCTAIGINYNEHLAPLQHRFWRHCRICSLLRIKPNVQPWQQRAWELTHN